jgi:hypothetical protein
VASFRFHLGDWSGADEIMPAASRRQTGGTLLYWQTCRAPLALGRGDVEAAAQAVAILATATAELTEPQLVGAWGVLSAELLRRSGDLDDARAVVDVRISALALTGLRVEGDAGEAARDRRDEDAAAVARTRAAALLERSRAAAESAWVVEAAQLATAEAERARGRGRGGALAGRGRALG